ncbi:purine catabolism regulator [Rhodoligotrophos appendicifer]|uniref:helix-turn-helix domain-containing protein n=1 Tax=Rhodoligotrophos appendicifer TaxID=987056 RepID=UPI0014795E9E|nr:helix-turn-helix domain-containing protein [Rhodoligotrophos appendicifer]
MRGPLAGRAGGSEGAVAFSHFKGTREIASLINEGSDLQTIFERVVVAICGHTTWSRSGIMAVDRASGYSVLVARCEPQASNEGDLPNRWLLATSPSRIVAETNQPIVIDDAQIRPEYPGYQADALARGYHTAVILPLRCTDEHDRPLVLSVNSERKVFVTAEEEDFLLTICHLVAIAVHKVKSLQEQQEMTARLERTLRVNSSLLERVLGGSSMQTIAGIVETLLQDEIVILDFTTDNTYANRSPTVELISDHEWRLAVKGPLADLLARFVQMSRPNNFRLPVSLDLRPAGIDLDCPVFVEPLQIDGETAGGLIIFPRGGTLNGLDLLMAQEAKLSLSAQLMRTHIDLRRHEGALSELFSRLFEADGVDSRETCSRASRLGVDLNSPARLLMLGEFTGHEGGLGPLVRSLARMAQGANSRAVLVEQSGDLFFHLPSDSDDPQRLLATLGRQLTDMLRWRHGESPVMALGPVCRRPEDYRAARDHCRRLLSLARLFGRRGIVKLEDFGPFAVLLSAVDPTAVRAFVGDMLSRVEAYDREHGGDLTRTTSAFLERGYRYQATADSLGIHVSTLRYRLGRLNELFGLDLEDPQTRFALSLAFHLKSMTGAGSTVPEAE